MTFEHAKLKKHAPNDLKCGVFSSSSNDKVYTVAAVADEGDVVYQGDVHKDEVDFCRTFLAVRNKRNNKMRIYEASSVMLSPTVASNFVDDFEPQNVADAKYNLNQTFGSKKAKRAADQIARMAVNVDAVKETLSATANDIKVEEDALIPVEDDTYLKMLPPCNREASIVAEVYPINGLLEKKQLKELEKYLSEASEDDQILDPARLSPFYQTLVTKTSKDTKLAALLLYAESLIRFCKFKKITKTDKVCLYSDLVDKRIKKDFLSGSAHSKIVTKSCLDKAAMYIIILGLIIGSFSVDLEVITRSVPNLSIARIRMLARIVGTRLDQNNKEGSKDVAFLRVPVPQLATLPKGYRKRRQ